MKASRSFAEIKGVLKNDSDFIATIVNQVEATTIGIFDLEFPGNVKELTSEETVVITTKFPKIKHDNVVYHLHEVIQSTFLIAKYHSSVIYSTSGNYINIMTITITTNSGTAQLETMQVANELNASIRCDKFASGGDLTASEYDVVKKSFELKYQVSTISGSDEISFIPYHQDATNMQWISFSVSGTTIRFIKASLNKSTHHLTISV